MATTKKTKKQAVIDRRVTWAQATRDIVVGAMDKGQLLPVGLFTILLLMVFRMQTSDVYALANRLLDLIKNHSIIGYFGWIATLGAWCWHARHMRAQHNVESGRIGREKSRLQERLSGEQLTSSRR